MILATIIFLGVVSFCLKNISLIRHGIQRSKATTKKENQVTIIQDHSPSQDQVQETSTINLYEILKNSYWSTIHPHSELTEILERVITSRFKNWEPYIIFGFLPQMKLTWDIINKVSDSTDIFSCKFGTCKIDLPWVFVEDKRTHKFKIYRLGNFRRWDLYFNNYDKLMTNESFCDPQLELISYFKKLNNDEITATREEVLHKTLRIQEYALLYCGKSYEFFDYMEFLIYFNARHNIYLDWGEWLKTESPHKWYKEFLESMKSKVFVLKSIFPEDKKLLKKFEDF